MVSETNLAILLSILFGAIFVYETKRAFFSHSRFLPKERELRARVLELQSALCDVSAIVSSVEKSFSNIYSPQSIDVVKKISRARTIITSLYRRIEQVSSLLDIRSKDGINAATELLNRSVSTEIGSIDGLISNDSQGEQIPPEQWLAELRRIRRELSLVVVQKAA